jgi:flagellar export protein FliJ
MRKFQFKFAAVLKLRKSREEESLRHLAAAQRRYQDELDRKAKLRRDLQSSLERREDLASITVDSIPYQLENEFISGTKQRLIQADQAIFRASKAVEKALRAYLAARRQTKMIETLHDKAYAEFRKERAKYERRQQDDLTIMRHRLRADYLAAEETSAL